MRTQVMILIHFEYSLCFHNAKMLKKSKLALLMAWFGIYGSEALC